MAGLYAIFLGSVCHIVCRNPLILTDFHAIRTPIVWHALGAYFFANMGGGGGQNYFHPPLPPPPPRPHTGPEPLELRKVHFEVRKMSFVTPPKKAWKSQFNSLKKSDMKSLENCFKKDY